ncbi:hypothetical protein [Candidatus Enterovibrio escicola]|uniref:hypothetical protein n=1 Tax=Candidatus Enterovibrio escicola TaxID=1927127 RepID=UPI001CC30A41|nr:hypothetical protein [Candidatus Enterovibrio escacola]
MSTIELVSTNSDITLFNCFCLQAKTTFNVNGSYNGHHAKIGILHEEKPIKYMTSSVYS